MVEADEEYVAGFRMSDFFQAHRRKALIIVCSDYENLREMEGKENFADLPEVHTDKLVVEAGLRRVGFIDEDMTRIENPDLRTIKDEIKKLTREVMKNTEANEKTLVYVYYAGHGCQDNYTKIILNVNSP